MVVPYNTSSIEKLQRPLESTLRPPVAVVHEPVGIGAGVQGLLERIEVQRPRRRFIRAEQMLPLPFWQAVTGILYNGAVATAAIQAL